MARIAKRDLTRQQQLARGPVDLPFLALVLILLGIGLVMLLSASSYTASVEKGSNYDAAFYFKRQAAFAVMGLVIMYVASKFDYQWLRGISPFIMLAAILLLMAVLVIGSTSNQATRCASSPRRWPRWAWCSFSPPACVSGIRAENTS